MVWPGREPWLQQSFDERARGETLAGATHDFFGAAGPRILRPSSQRSKRSVLAVNEAD